MKENSTEKRVHPYRTPLSIIYKQVGKEIVVYLKTGEIYVGTLSKVDNYMNLLLENTIEQSSNNTRRYGRALIRGNNILLIKVSAV